ncbi:hypothetical protein H0N96_03220, partial [Candidatus Micrarchaeota archaeon]|nr:hypothetical protein [Candidatus Micrarchaeota archaeon]
MKKSFAFAASFAVLISLLLFGCVNVPNPQENAEKITQGLFGVKPTPGASSGAVSLNSFKTWDELYYFLKASQT